MAFAVRSPTGSARAQARGATGPYYPIAEPNLQEVILGRLRAAGARLQLSFSGTQTVDEVRYDGHLVTGVMSQQTCPEFVSGPGALFANRKGTAMLIR